MCYHQTGSARFIGHCWGRGWRDATENLLQTSIINHLGSFPLRRICGTKKYNFFIPLCESFQVGGSGAWGRGEGAKKQTNKTLAASYKSSQTRTPEKVDRRYFPLFWKQEPDQNRKRRWLLLMNEPTLLYKRSPREASRRESGCATFISSIINNWSVNFCHQRHIFIHAELHSKHRKGKSCLVIIISNVKPIMLPSHQATTTCPKSIVLT